MAKPLEQLSFDSQRALEQFSSAFESAFEATDPATEWAKAFGLVESSTQLLITYPMSISAAGYVERKGDDAARDMYERSISITPIEWTDGVQAQKRRLEQNDFAVAAWTSEASRMAREAKRHGNILTARLLHANANIQLYKDATLGIDAGIPLFSASHQVNIFDSSKGTFKNVLIGGGTDFAGGTIDQAMLSAVLNHFRTGIKGANGQPMSQSPTDMIVHPAWEQRAKDFLESDLIRAAFLEGGTGSQKNTQLTTNNRYKGLINLVVADELAQVSGVDEDKLYFVNKNGAKPWILQDGGTPEETRFDGDSEFCKRTGKVRVNYHMLMGVTAALPHSIVRVDLTP
jgi:phage major head subunit gpT-like protein